MQKQINANKRNTFLAIVAFVIFVGLVGALFAYFYNSVSYVILFVIISVGYVVFQYFFADKEALLFSRAKQIQKNDNPKLFEIVSDISTSAKIPMPKVYVITTQRPMLLRPVAIQNILQLRLRLGF